MMKIAAAQLSASHDKQHNLDKILACIAKAKTENADLVVFPEAAMAVIDKNRGVKPAEIAEPLDGHFVSALASAARKHGIHVICGIYEKQPQEPARAYNTVVVLDDEGNRLHSYRKTHLYDAFSYHETQNILAGDTPLIPVRTKLGTIGLLVCYELRFPEISRTLALKGADILVVPTAWVAGPMKEEHLFTLARARALENTVFVCIAGQTGNIYTGGSAIFNPMGVVMASAGAEEELISAAIHPGQIQAARQKLPCLTHRRPEFYKLD